MYFSNKNNLRIIGKLFQSSNFCLEIIHKIYFSNENSLRIIGKLFFRFVLRVEKPS